MTTNLDRAGLLALGESYLAALTARKPARLTLAHRFRYTENGQDLALGDGLWASCDSEDATGLIAVCDLARQEMIQIARIREAGDRSLVGTRLRFDGTAICEMETIVARQQGGFLSPPEDWPHRPIFGEAIPDEARADRATMLEAADSYFVGLEQNTDALTNFHPDAHRIENGNIMTSNPDHENPIMRMGPKAQFATGFSAIVTGLRERRFLVDEETGVVCAMLFFDHLLGHREIRRRDGELMKPRAPFNRPFSFQTFECFKVWGGALREIEAVIAACPYGMKSGWAN